MKKPIIFSNEIYFKNKLELKEEEENYFPQRQPDNYLDDIEISILFDEKPIIGQQSKEKGKTKKRKTFDQLLGRSLKKSIVEDNYKQPHIVKLTPSNELIDIR